ncbi:MAG: DUF5000 domain-containing lipoprotein [Candidatus Pseudobacter hemicellulosilyticus]|uniref:DUF5000 domain-containing lipoprotein n=1 Tax=Candidatus Pseudobacter hemicellulosilyticus TaxID=3121375 RepID=A0AAJ5WU20_9BACT|nr:MAG: DUF5000 domain-containing lipoprotein [Pseudobacter sp.]
MKAIHNLSVLTLLLALAGCYKDEDVRKPNGSDDTRPDVVRNVQVRNFNGGAVLTYALPSSANFLYVMAEYRINDGKSRQTKSSYYIDSLVVDGFEKSQEYEVTLYAVSRADIKSDPVVVKVHPETPYYKLIKETVSIEPDFGGINILAQNPAKRPVTVNLITRNADLGRYEIEEQQFTALDDVRFSVRGYSSEPREFGVFISDQFGNQSDTIFNTVTPFYEELLDKSKFKVYRLPSDAVIDYGWESLYLFDGLTDGSSNGWHTRGGELPAAVTLDMGQSAKLSRFVMWHRPSAVYSYGSPKNFSLWGTEKGNPADAQIPTDQPEGTVVGDWTNLGNFRFPDPPSGNAPGSVTAVDEAFVKAGVNFNVPIDAPRARYIRLQVTSTWGGVDYCYFMELSVYGNP